MSTESMSTESMEPVLTDTVSNVLVVCTANICRSPLMELSLRDGLDPTRYSVDSAGVRGFDAAPVDSMVKMEMARHGLDPNGFASKRVNVKLIDHADLILTATREHRAEILSLQPTALRRTFTLIEFAVLAAARYDELPTTLPTLVADVVKRRSSAPSGLDVPDPYRGSPEVHREVADLIVGHTATVKAILNRLGTDQA